MREAARLGRGERVPQVPPHGRRPLDRELDLAPRRHRLVVDRHHDRRSSTSRRTSTGCRPMSRSTPTAQWTASTFASRARLHQGLRRQPDEPGLHLEGRSRRSSRATTPAARCATRSSLPDDELAKQATTIIGMNKNAPSQVCAECHAANQTTLRDWQEKTDTALGDVPREHHRRWRADDRQEGRRLDRQGRVQDLRSVRGRARRARSK